MITRFILAKGFINSHEGNIYRWLDIEKLHRTNQPWIGLCKNRIGYSNIKKEKLLRKRCQSYYVQLSLDKGHWTVVPDLQKSLCYSMGGTWAETWSRAHRTSKGWLFSSFCLKMKTLQLIPGYAFDLQKTLSYFLFNLSFIS